MPEPRTQLESDLFDALTIMFLSPRAAGRARAAVRAAVGEATFELLVAYLALIRTAHYIERARAGDRYRTLFESIDDGFCIIEKVDGEPGGPLDFRYIEANPAFAKQSGVGGVVTKTIRQMFPGEPEEWFLTYDAIAKTGEAMRFERGLVTQGRVLELSAFRVEDDTQRRVADLLARQQRARVPGKEDQQIQGARVFLPADAVKQTLEASRFTD